MDDSTDDEPCGVLMDDNAARKAKTADTYNAAADYFDHPALSFWDRFGQGTVDRVALHPGDDVLDVCAGSGASAIPAAQRVGPTGRVVAVDLAESLLALAAAKAGRLGLANLEIRHQDLETLDYPEQSFDAVLIVFGLFFLPDWQRATAALWRLVKPGGRLAITTWGPELFEPANSMFWQAVAELRPDLHKAFNPWDELTDPSTVHALLVGAGADHVRIESVDGMHPISRPEDFWTIVLGSGFRATVEAMDPSEQRRLEQHLEAALAADRVTALQTNVIYAVATKGL